MSQSTKDDHEPAAVGRNLHDSRAGRFVSHCRLPSPREREILIVLMEECAEVSHRASKAIRFGIDQVQPGQPETNRERLSVEAGDLLGMIAMATAAGLLDEEIVLHATARKAAAFEKYSQTVEE